MFRFKHFIIDDKNCAMKVGTDGVILAAWASLSHEGANLLDIGCGSGILSLIMAQRLQGAIYVDAIDIDDGAITDCKKNFKSSPWNRSLNVINGNFVSYSKLCGKKYDMVISNPPFFTEDIHSPDIKRTLARNTSSLSFDTLFAGVAYITEPTSIFAIITSADSYSHIAQIALLNGFYLSRLTWVVTVEGIEPKRVLTEWGRVQTQYTVDTLVISDKNGNYTPQYKKLTEDFYL